MANPNGDINSDNEDGGTSTDIDISDIDASTNNDDTSDTSDQSSDTNDDDTTTNPNNASTHSHDVTGGGLSSGAGGMSISDVLSGSGGGGISGGGGGSTTVTGGLEQETILVHAWKKVKHILQGMGVPKAPTTISIAGFGIGGNSAGGGDGGSVKSKQASSSYRAGSRLPSVIQPVSTSTVPTIEFEPGKSIVAESPGVVSDITAAATAATTTSLSTTGTSPGGKPSLSSTLTPTAQVGGAGRSMSIMSTPSRAGSIRPGGGSIIGGNDAAVAAAAAAASRNKKRQLGQAVLSQRQNSEIDETLADDFEGEDNRHGSPDIDTDDEGVGGGISGGNENVGGRVTFHRTRARSKVKGHQLPITIPHGFQLTRTLMQPKPTLRNVIYVSNTNNDAFLTQDAHSVCLVRGTVKVMSMSTGGEREKSQSPVIGLSRWLFVKKWRITIVATMHLELK
ncbi:hypothetical protein HDU76_002721, partial [Blyttiomyces sp. JEL0837]